MDTNEILIERRQVVARVPISSRGTMHPLEASIDVIGAYFNERLQDGESMVRVEFTFDERLHAFTMEVSKAE